MACMFYFARCINIIFNSLLAQLVKYDVHTTRKIKFIHAVIYHILLLYIFFTKTEYVGYVCSTVAIT